MIKTAPKDNTVVPNTLNPTDAIKYINDCIDRTHENLCVDLSFMNIIDASYVSTMCSTHQFINHPDRIINWKVSSELVKNFNKDFYLGNSIYEI